MGEAKENFGKAFFHEDIHVFLERPVRTVHQPAFVVVNKQVTTKMSRQDDLTSKTATWSQCLNSFSTIHLWHPKY